MTYHGPPDAAAAGYPKVLPRPLEEALGLWHEQKDGRRAPHDDQVTKDYGCPYCEDIVGAFLTIERAIRTGASGAGEG